MDFSQVYSRLNLDMFFDKEKGIGGVGKSAGKRGSPVAPPSQPVDYESALQQQYEFLFVCLSSKWKKH